MTFDDYWKQHGLATSPAALGLAFREVAEKAWNAANSDENAKLREVEEAATYAHAQLSKCFGGEGSCDLVYAERAYFKLKAVL